MGENDISKETRTQEAYVRGFRVRRSATLKACVADNVSLPDVSRTAQKTGGNSDTTSTSGPSRTRDCGADRAVPPT